MCLNVGSSASCDIRAFKMRNICEAWRSMRKVNKIPSTDKWNCLCISVCTLLHEPISTLHIMIAPTNSVAKDIKVKFTGHSTQFYLNWATFLWANRRGCTPKQMPWHQNRTDYCNLLISVFHLQNTTLPTGQIETAKNHTLLAYYLP